MSEIYCKGCGHSFPHKGKDLVSCPHCGREKHIPGAIQCARCGIVSKRGTKFCADCGAALFKLCSRERSGCGDRPLDADYCSECGAKALAYEEQQVATEAERVRRDAEREAEERAAGTFKVLLVGALLVALWFLCVTPIRKWVGEVEARAQATATAQVRREASTQAFNRALGDLDLRMSLVSYDEDSEFLAYAVYVRNNGSSAHSITLSYTDCPSDRPPLGALDRECGDRLETSTLGVAAHSTSEFSAGCLLRGAILPGVSITGMCGLRIRVDQIDGISRGSERYGSWNWRIGIFDKDGSIYPWFVDEGWHKLDPADLDFDDPSKTIGD